MRDEVKIVENPISGNILIVPRFLAGGSVSDLAKTAAKAAREYPDRTIIMNCDGREHIVTVTAEERRNKELTSLDFYEKICVVRDADFRSYMFNVTSKRDDKIQVEFNEKASPYIGIYAAALDAAILSRSNNNVPVEFSFRDKTLSINGTDEPADIEILFPPEKRSRKDSDPLPPASYKYY